MVLANKWVLKTVTVAPLFFLWLQLVVAILLMIVCQSLGFVNFSSTHSPRSYFPRMDWQKARKLWMLVAVNVIGLTFNTYTLAYIDASIYQVARSLILPLTVALQVFYLGEKLSASVLVSCLIVCSGFLVGLFIDQPGGEGGQSAASTNMRGIIYGLLSSCTTALHSIVIKASVEVCEGNTLELVWYNNFLSTIVLLPLVWLTGDISDFSLWISTFVGDPHVLRVFVIGILVTGIFGFLINLAGFFQIKITSPATHMISSAVRGVLQTFLAVAFFNEVLTSSRLWGIALILIGSTLYTWFKSRPQKTEPYQKLPA